MMVFVVVFMFVCIVHNIQFSFSVHCTLCNLGRKPFNGRKRKIFNNSHILALVVNESPVVLFSFMLDNL